MNKLYCLVLLAMLITSAHAPCPAEEQAGAAIQGKILSAAANMMDAYEVDLRKDQGIEPGDIVQVVRDGNPIATGVVIAVGKSSSTIVLNGSPPPCRSGDTVRFLRHKKKFQETAGTAAVRPGGGGGGGRVIPSIKIELMGQGNPEAGMKPLTTQKVSFTYRYSGNDKTVEGYLSYPSAVPSPTVLFAQSAGTSAENDRDTIAAITNNGYAALIIDYADHIDLLAAIVYLQALSFVDPGKIGLIGYDRGASAVIFVAEYASGLKGVVEISGHFLVDGGAIASAAKSPMAYLDRISCPILIIHGEKDTEVPVSEAYALEQKLSEYRKNSEIKILHVEGHDIRNWEGTIGDALRFLEEHMK
jgi:dienelactone hydrolase